MSLHVYVKETQTVKRQMAHLLSYVSLIMGAMLLFWSFYPIISFQIYSQVFIQNDIIMPVPRSDIASSIQEAGSVLGSYNVFSNNLRDFVQADLWFPSKPQDASAKNGIVNTNKEVVKEYTISIPKINITNAKVTVGGEDLSKSLVHYLPTSLPGQKGNVAIFGHSTLPQLYNVNDYKTIFTYLPSLEKGDIVNIKVGDQTYHYQIYDMFVVKPDQVSVLEQKYDAAYLTLVTCVPPGTVFNRLIVRAKLVDSDEISN